MKTANSSRSHFPFFAGSPTLLWQLLFFYLPLGAMVVSSLLSFSSSGEWIGFTLEKLLHFLDPTYLKVIGASLLLALSNTTLCLLVAYPLAYFMTFPGRRYSGLMLFFLIIPFWTNFLLHVYAWFFVLEREGIINQLLSWLHLTQQPLHLLNTIPSIMVMMLYYYLPFMLLPIYSSLERFDHKLIEASLDLGAGSWHTVRRVIIPLSGRGIRSGIFLVFIPSFGEFAIPELMGGDKWVFAGNVISRFVLGDQTEEYGAAFTVAAGAVLLLAILLLNSVTKRILDPGGGERS